MKDPFVPQTRLVHEHSHGRGYSAIFLLGLLADKEAADLLYAILEESAVTALARIRDSHSDTRSAMAEAYRKLRRKDLRFEITLPGAPHIPYDMLPKLRLCIEQTILRRGIEPLSWR